MCLQMKGGGSMSCNIAEADQVYEQTTEFVGLSAQSGSQCRGNASTLEGVGLPRAVQDENI